MNTTNYTISQYLQRDDCEARVSCGDVWLVWSTSEKAWIVYQRGALRGHPKTICCTSSEHEAVAAFRKANGEDAE